MSEETLETRIADREYQFLLHRLIEQGPYETVYEIVRLEAELSALRAAQPLTKEWLAVQIKANNESLMSHGVCYCDDCREQIGRGRLLHEIQSGATLPDERPEQPLTRAIELLHAFADHEDQPCSFDHHGYCQEHDDFSGDGCKIAKARALLDSLADKEG